MCRLLIYLAFLFSISIKAQNYKPFLINESVNFISDSTINNDEDMHYYSLPSFHYKYIRIDSIKNNATSESYRFYSEPFNNNPNQFRDIYCVFDTGASWIGKKSEYTNNKQILFYNSLGDTIRIDNNLQVDSCNVFYNFNNDTVVEICLEQIITKDVLGVSDSVKVFALKLKDIYGNIINSPVNSITIEISKNFGFIKIINIRDFPLKKETYSITGLQNQGVGTKLLTNKQIYDFEIGDEFHYLIETMVGDILPNVYPVQLFEVRRVKQKDVINNNDSVKYVIERYNRYSWNDSVLNLYTFDTITYPYNDFFVLKNEISEKLPFETIRSADSIWSKIGYYTFEERPEDNKKFIVAFRMDFIKNYDSCYYYWVPLKSNNDLWEELHDYNIYMDGCGVQIHDVDDFSWGPGPYFACNLCEKLVYYNTSKGIWGTPLDMPINVNKVSYLKKIKLFPNPVIDYLKVEFNNNQNLKIKILDITGKIVYTCLINKIDNNIIIDFSKMSSGIYFIQLINSDEIISDMFVKN